MITLESDNIKEVLTDLHNKSDADFKHRMAENITSKKTAYMSVSSEEGKFINFLAKASQAQNIVEYGCSYGISTIYLAAAAKDNGGFVTTTEMEPNKVKGAQQNIDSVGLTEYVEILEGDALKTLSEYDQEIDFLFLDGAKSLYLPVFEMLQERLVKGAVICADNADRPDAQPFVQFIMDQTKEYSSFMAFDGRLLCAVKG